MKLIPLTDGNYALVDDGTPWIACSLFKWYNKDGYAVTSMSGRTVSMHRFLMNPTAKDMHLEIDHINGNTLDNRLCNLRLATRAQNAANRKTTTGGVSRYKGVTWRKNARKWIAYICVNDKQIHLGYFTDEIEAAKAYDRAAIEHFGEFARLNF